MAPQTGVVRQLATQRYGEISTFLKVVHVAGTGNAKVKKVLLGFHTQVHEFLRQRDAAACSAQEPCGEKDQKIGCEITARWQICLLLTWRIDHR
ncbi:MAG: hypothetical protein AAGA38_15915 [Pseudomonadota bacterium]